MANLRPMELLKVCLNQLMDQRDFKLRFTNLTLESLAIKSHSDSLKNKLQRGQIRI